MDKFTTPLDPKDLLLANVAIRIQLSPTNHKLAVQRLETLAERLDRAESPLAGKVRVVYAQGSMAIHATIAPALRYDEFDVDGIVQMELPPGTTPQQALDTLFEAVRGEPGSRYYAMTKRNTRCVTVQYAEMHVDLTPAELVPGRNPRVSEIFHHRPEEPRDDGKRVVANPFGFAEWFNEVTPRFRGFEEFYEGQSRALDRRSKAETEDVPEPVPAYLKPPAVIALQLIKRFRNVRYDRRDGRQPPSVMLACLVANFAGQSGTPYGELLHQARSLRRHFEQLQTGGQLIHVANPRCPDDVFTDRWPANLNEQGLFLQDLAYLVGQLERIEHDAPLEVIADVFARLFGEEIASTVIREFADSTGRQIERHGLITDYRGGRVDIGRSGIGASSASAAAIVSPTVVRATPKHTFFGHDD